MYRYDRHVKPARPAFYWFVQAQRDNVKASLPVESSDDDISEYCAQIWADLTSAERSKFEELADKDKARYTKELDDAYQAELAYSRRLCGGLDSYYQQREKSLPEPPQSAFDLFRREKWFEVRDTLYEDVCAMEVDQEVAKRWNNLDPSSKARYGDLALKDRVRYEDELALHGSRSESSNDDGHRKSPVSKAISGGAKVAGCEPDPRGQAFDEKQERESPPKRGPGMDPIAPKRALSAFFYFCKEERSKVRADLPNAGAGDIAKESARRWIGLSKSDKVKYEIIASQDEARYKEELAIYRKKVESSGQHRKQSSGAGSSTDPQ